MAIQHVHVVSCRLCGSNEHSAHHCPDRCEPCLGTGRRLAHIEDVHHAETTHHMTISSKRPTHSDNLVDVRCDECNGTGKKPAPKERRQHLPKIGV